MKMRFYFEHKLTIILVAILLLVTVSGNYTFGKLTEIITKVNDVSRFDMRLVTFKSLMNDITVAENSVKTYNITKDQMWYESFQNASEGTTKKLEELRMFAEEKKDNRLDVDSLETLVYLKLGKLQEFVFVRDDERVERALSKVETQIEKTAKTHNFQNGESSKNPEPEKATTEKKKGLIDGLFKKRSAESVDKTSQSTSAVTKDAPVIDMVKDELKKVRQEEQRLDDVLKTKELELITSINEITGKIWSMLNDFERAEYLLIAKQSEQIETSVKKTNRQIIFFYVTICLLTVFMAVVTIKYVRKRRLYRRALRAAKYQAEDLADTKEKFIANISHEIRTPMNSIVGFAEQLAKTQLTEEQKEHLEMIHKSSEHLLYLVNDVLDYTKLRSSKVSLEEIPFDLRCAISDTTEFVEQLALDKDIEVSCDIDKNVPEVFVGDIFRLRQILLNLMSNAVKFCDRGAVRLHVRMLEQKNNVATLLFEVADTGIGMSNSQIETIFNEFEQAEVSTARKYGGSGLGLSIVKMLVNLFGGNISIVSEINAGTKVLVELPFLIGSKVELKTPDIVHEPVKHTELSGINVLIVDDEEFNRKLLSTILRSHGIEFHEAKDGLEALEKINRHNFDVVLMDIRMPNLDGIEAVRRIRKLKNNNKNGVPVIALTAAVTEKDKMNYFDAGMNGFLPKPFKEAELIKKLNKQINPTNGKVWNTADKKTGTDFKPLVTENLNLTELYETANGDMNFYYDMLKIFITNTRQGVEEMRSAYEDRHWERVADLAHKSSSPCRHISALALHQTLKEIELNCRKKIELKSVGELIQTAEKLSQILFAELEQELSKSGVSV